MSSTSQVAENQPGPMTRREHRYQIGVEWTGNNGCGTADYKSYRRDHKITSGDKVIIEASSDAAFRGDAARWNPEEFLVAALSSCHMLSYLHMCAVGHVTVMEYSDQAEGIMMESGDGGGDFKEVVLRPVVTVSRGSDIFEAASLHHNAHEKCFIARSVKFPVRCEPQIIEA